MFAEFANKRHVGVVESVRMAGGGPGEFGFVLGELLVKFGAGGVRVLALIVGQSVIGHGVGQVLEFFLEGFAAGGRGVHEALPGRVLESFFAVAFDDLMANRLDAAEDGGAVGLDKLIADSGRLLRFVAAVAAWAEAVEAVQGGVVLGGPFAGAGVQAMALGAALDRGLGRLFFLVDDFASGEIAPAFAAFGAAVGRPFFNERNGIIRSRLRAVAMRVALLGEDVESRFVGVVFGEWLGVALHQVIPEPAFDGNGVAIVVFAVPVAVVAQ